MSKIVGINGIQEARGKMIFGPPMPSGLLIG